MCLKRSEWMNEWMNEAKRRQTKEQKEKKIKRKDNDFRWSACKGAHVEDE